MPKFILPKLIDCLNYCTHKCGSYLQFTISAIYNFGNSFCVRSNGEAVLKISAGALHNITLLDIVMPGMDGYEVSYKPVKS